jgi:ABC-type phosphate transport system substrate-binding protein
MLGFKQKTTVRTGLRAALLAGATVAALGLGGINAGSAAAEVKCTGNNITGQGASLQKIAQQNVWGPSFAASICNKGTFPTITYNSTGSGGGLKEWNHDGKRGSINTALQFIATDDAPTAAQIGNITSVAGGATLAVIPVTQTALSIVANPPAGCEIEAITNAQLASVFEGKTTSWSQLETAEGAGCASPVTRVVRKDGSGTTYQFKNYLFQLYKKGLFCTSGGTEGKASWQELEPITNGETGAPNTTWPETCGEKTLSTLAKPTGTGGGEVVKKVNTTAGSIGYAALPDAKANISGTTIIMELQNNGQKKAIEAEYASPASGAVANCGGMQYKTPANVNSGINLDWSPVFGAQPSIGGSDYPLCALTYILAFHGYSLAGFPLKDETTVKDYVGEYIVQANGQKDITSNNYAPLPSSPEVRFDVLGAARKAAGKITF